MVVRGETSSKLQQLQTDEVLTTQPGDLLQPLQQQLSACAASSRPLAVPAADWQCSAWLRALLCCIPRLSWLSS